MRHFSVLGGPTREAIQAAGKKFGLSDETAEIYQHPQEDYLVASLKPPVFVVADGVTLDFRKLIKEQRSYPNPSPAGEVAKVFCRTVQRAARKRFAHFNSVAAIEVFKEANAAVAAYNAQVGQSDIAGNPTGLYAATGAFLIIKKDKAYFLSICDAFFAHFDKDMKLKHISSGVCRPYAVINGEERMVEHIEGRMAELVLGDRLFIVTDGFEPYLRDLDFLALFKAWPHNLKEQIRSLSATLNEANPDRFGHERSLIAVVYE